MFTFKLSPPILALELWLGVGLWRGATLLLLLDPLTPRVYARLELERDGPGASSTSGVGGVGMRTTSFALSERGDGGGSAVRGASRSLRPPTTSVDAAAGGCVPVRQPPARRSRTSTNSACAIERGGRKIG